MSRRMIGILLLLAGSEILGVLSGHWYFGLFTRTVPTAVVTEFNRAAAYAMFLVRGLVLGLVLFLWALVAVKLSSFFRQPAGAGARGEGKP